MSSGKQIILAVGLVMAIILSGIAHAETTLEKCQREGYITVAFANEKPAAYADTHGKLTGRAVEVSRVVFTRIGIAEMQGMLTQWGSLIPSLLAKRVDAITADMYIKPARCKKVSFSEPISKYGEGLAVKKGNPKKLHSLEDIAANPEAKLAVISGGAVEYQYARAVGVPDSRILRVPDPASGMAALQAGRVDAFCHPRQTIKDMVKTANDPNLEVASPYTDPVIDGKVVVDYGATAFRQEDTALKEAYNRELKKFIKSGEMAALYIKWKVGAEEVPEDHVNTKDICLGK
jgi:polar amino acid transport system substrate-binding protein